jgi:glycosyltransferase involved in cell wall biosynthesis
MKDLDYSNVWIVIAAYNEGSVIAKVIENIINVFPNIVVVDDGSKDITAEAAKNAGAKIVSHPINLGQGAALQTGIDFALLQNAEVIVTFDADGQHRIEDAITMVEYLIDNQIDIVCGSRFLNVRSSTLPFKRKLLLKMATLFTRITTGIPVTDAHNGLRALSLKAAKAIRITQNRMAHASEIIFQIHEKSLIFAEIPVEIIYTEYSLKKGQKVSNSINILLDIFIGRIEK